MKTIALLCFLVVAFTNVINDINAYLVMDLDQELDVSFSFIFAYFY